jgi:hypothetical protein
MYLAEYGFPLLGYLIDSGYLTVGG